MDEGNVRRFSSFDGVAYFYRRHPGMARIRSLSSDRRIVGFRYPFSIGHDTGASSACTTGQCNCVVVVGIWRRRHRWSGNPVSSGRSVGPGRCVFLDRCCLRTYRVVLDADESQRA